MPASSVIEDPFLDDLNLRIELSSGKEKLLSDIKDLIQGHGLKLTDNDAWQFLQKTSRISRANLDPDESRIRITRKFTGAFCRGKPVLPGYEEKIAEILEDIKPKGTEAEALFDAALKSKDEEHIAALEKQHSHFSVNVFENFRGSGFWGRCARLTGVGVGAILMGKACTYDLHTNQEGETPNPATKYVDMAAGLALTVGSLCILPNKKGPQHEIIKLLRGSEEIGIG